MHAPPPPLHFLLFELTCIITLELVRNRSRKETSRKERREARRAQLSGSEPGLEGGESVRVLSEDSLTCIESPIADGTRRQGPPLFSCPVSQFIKEVALVAAHVPERGPWARLVPEVSKLGYVTGMGGCEKDLRKDLNDEKKSVSSLTAI